MEEKIVQMEVQAEIARRPYVPAGGYGFGNPAQAADPVKQQKIDEQLQLLKEKLDAGNNPSAES